MNEYRFPDWVQTITKVKQINTDSNTPIWVSLLRSKDSAVIDIRLWLNNRPSRCGLFLTYKSVSDLVSILNQYLAGKDMTELDA